MRSMFRYPVFILALLCAAAAPSLRAETLWPSGEALQRGDDLGILPVKSLPDLEALRAASGPAYTLSWDATAKQLHVICPVQSGESARELTAYYTDNRLRAVVFFRRHERALFEMHDRVLRPLFMEPATFEGWSDVAGEVYSFRSKGIFLAYREPDEARWIRTFTKETWNELPGLGSTVPWSAVEAPVKAALKAQDLAAVKTALGGRPAPHYGAAAREILHLKHVQSGLPDPAPLAARFESAADWNSKMSAYWDTLEAARRIEKANDAENFTIVPPVAYKDLRPTRVREITERFSDLLSRQRQWVTQAAEKVYTGAVPGVGLGQALLESSSLKKITCRELDPDVCRRIASRFSQRWLQHHVEAESLFAPLKKASYKLLLGNSVENLTNELRIELDRLIFAESPYKKTWLRSDDRGSPAADSPRIRLTVVEPWQDAGLKPANGTIVKSSMKRRDGPADPESPAVVARRKETQARIAQIDEELRALDSTPLGTEVKGSAGYVESRAGVNGGYVDRQMDAQNTYRFGVAEDAAYRGERRKALRAERKTLEADAAPRQDDGYERVVKGEQVSGYCGPVATKVQVSLGAVSVVTPLTLQIPCKAEDLVSGVGGWLDAPYQLRASAAIAKELAPAVQEVILKSAAADPDNEWVRYWLGADPAPTGSPFAKLTGANLCR